MLFTKLSEEIFCSSETSIVLFDEMSMFGSMNLEKLNDRLNQIKPNADSTFGGMSIILFGDFGQLPPIRDSIMWKQSFEEKYFNGFTLYCTFNKCINLTTIYRQKDVNFINLLTRIRNGLVTEQDWHTLLKRNPIFFQNKIKNFSDITRLFFKNVDVHNYNLDKLKDLQRQNIPIAKIVADHAGDPIAARASTEKAWGLQPVLYLAQGAKVMLRRNLLQQFGLINGSQGNIVDIIYDTNSTKFPKAIIVDFPDYQGPALFKNHPFFSPFPSLLL